MEQRKLSELLQESIVALLCFHPEQYRLLRNYIPLDGFTGIARDVARTAFDYIDQYHCSPQDHTVDLIKELGEKTPDRKEMYERFLLSISDGYKTVNIPFVMDKIHHFLRFRLLQSKTVEMFDVLSGEAPDMLEQADRIAQEMRDERRPLFDPGTFFSDTQKSLAFLDAEYDECFPTGIELFDRPRLGPTRKRLHMLIGVSKRGKSWWLIHLAKQALILGYKVCYVSLELDEPELSRRFCQTFFGLSHRPGDVQYVKFETRDGILVGRTLASVHPRLTFQDDGAKQSIDQMIVQTHPKLPDRVMFKNLVCRQFPTGSLTVNQLDAYLDGMALWHKFVPDLLLLDYVDLMHTDARNLRISLGNLCKEIRGLAIRRNLALATVTQANRESLNKSWVGIGNVGEDWSKIAHSDYVFTFSQTEEERKWGCARITAADVRTGASGMTAYVSQAYAIGQFVMKVCETTVNNDDYFQLVKEAPSEPSNSSRARVI